MSKPEDEVAFDREMKRISDQMNEEASQHLFILEGHTPVPCKDFVKWAMSYEDRGRIVQQDQIRGYWVSTVFLGINTRLSGKPLLFETMAFLNHKATYEFTLRYSTWDEAVAGHALTCERLK
jgi:hypothetical protein